MVEIIVVLVILALMMGMVVPRFAGSQRRALELVVDQVADLLVMYAQRESLGARPVGIYHDTNVTDESESLGWLSVVVLEPEDPTDPRTAVWNVDRNVQPIMLPELITAVMFEEDGEMLDITATPFAVPPGQQRPEIRITLEAGNRLATVTLPPFAMTPVVSGLGTARDSNYSVERRVVDLDAVGRSREDW